MSTAGIIDPPKAIDPEVAAEILPPEPHDLKQMPPKEWFELREQCRTDLQFLCVNALGYLDVSTDIKPHRKVIEALQHFRGGIDELNVKGGDITLQKLRRGYRPRVPMWELRHPSPQRKSLILCSRGFLKSSIATIAHSIQWSLNYPNVRILISSGTGDQVNKFMSGILQHWRFNDVLRWLFPEFVAYGNKVERFGSGAGLTVLARTAILPEMTYTTSSIGAAVAGGHYDDIKHDDVVNETNVLTPESILSVNEHLRMTAPLLERRHGLPGWTEYIGTRYDYTDAYGVVLDAEKKLPKEKRSYVVVFEPAWTGEWGTATAKAVWPERLPMSELQAIENDPLQGPNMLASQYGLIPRPASSGLVTSRKEIIWTPRKVLNEIYAALRLHVTIDLHGMAPLTAHNKTADNDYTAITLAGFARDGHCYILSIYHGRPSPFEVIAYLFDLYHRHPRIINMKVQKDHMWNVLASFLNREQTKRQIWLPLDPTPVNNQVSKKNKIKALQPWFKQSVISFADDISCRFHLEEEIMRFPRFHDDILDTLTDQLSNRDGKPETDTQHQAPLPGQPLTLPGTTPVFVGFDEHGQPLYSGMPESKLDGGVDPTTGM